MNVEDIKKIIDSGESINVEFKESKTELNKDVYQSVGGMLNRLGGHLLLGVKNDKTVVGVDRDCVEKIKKNFVTSINNPDKISPTVYIKPEEFEIDGLVVIYALIPNSTDVHRVSGRIYDRNEDGDIDITNNTNLVAQMYNRKTSMYTETKIFPYAEINDLDKELLSRIRIMAHNRANREHMWERMTDLEILKSANLYRRDPLTGEEGITLAGILLLGTRELILSALPHYKTDAIVRIKNTDRYDDREVILDNLIVSYDKLMDFVTKHLDDKFYLEGSQRVDLRNKIFREVCANMLIHREFSSAYPAKLIIEKDTVKTENANKPNGYGAIDAFSFSPYPKNPNIARFFREIGLADELGSGVKNVNHYLKIYSGASPEFIEGDVFKQVLPITEKGYKIQDRVQDRIQDNKQKTVYIKVIEFCSEAKSTSEIMGFLGLKSRASFKKRILDPMLRSDLIVMTIPDKPTSRNQKYVAKK